MWTYRWTTLHRSFTTWTIRFFKSLTDTACVWPGFCCLVPSASKVLVPGTCPKANEVDNVKHSVTSFPVECVHVCVCACVFVCAEFLKQPKLILFAFLIWTGLASVIPAKQKLSSALFVDITTLPVSRKTGDRRSEAYTPWTKCLTRVSGRSVPRVGRTGLG